MGLVDERLLFFRNTTIIDVVSGVGLEVLQCTVDPAHESCVPFWVFRGPVDCAHRQCAFEESELRTLMFLTRFRRVRYRRKLRIHDQNPPYSFCVANRHHPNDLRSNGSITLLGLLFSILCVKYLAMILLACITIHGSSTRFTTSNFFSTEIFPMRFIPSFSFTVLCCSI